MTAFVTIRAARQDDAPTIERLAANVESVQWGGLPHLTEHLLESRWRQTNITPTFVQVVETDRGLQGYSDVYQVTPQLVRFHGVATNVAMAEKLIDWTHDEVVSQGISLQTSLSSVTDGRLLFRNFVDCPLYAPLVKRGFSSFSTTSVMRLLRDSEIKQRIFPKSFRLVPYDEKLLPSLMATYYAAWPKDYYENEDSSSITNIFREAHADDLRLMISGVGDVVGYVLLSRTTESGVIDEVAVHPSHRRRGFGEVLTQWAIRVLGERTITLVVMDDNPARFLYEKLGFVVWEERLDLILPST